MRIAESFTGKIFPLNDRTPIHCGTSCYRLADVNNTNIDINLVSTMPSTTLLTPINKSLKRQYKTRELDGLWTKVCIVHLYKVLWELDTLPSFFYYKLLVICIWFRWYIKNHVTQNGCHVQVLRSNDTTTMQDTRLIISCQVSSCIHIYFIPKLRLLNTFISCITKLIGLGMHMSIAIMHSISHVI